ncbi:hypothetical protein B0H16DRAFT_1890187 [Mycena metata]|uniref:Uncharacterized protein n=1 Tax=Mycena metata TaxID=1033252 RepID=A0AAD7IGY1_9AGAR|nr:hypothetical protein B0H16DRAFT_1890187 [Mycena metata]
MHYPSFFLKALSSLVLTASVHAQHTERGNDLHCPEGFDVGFVHDSYTFNAPVHKFTDPTKSFFDISWYGITLTNTTGTDNVPGATRSGSLDGGYFHETLTAYSVHPSALEYTVRGDPYTYAPPNSTAAPLAFAGYVETTRIESICSGRATYIDLISYICSADQVAGYDFAHKLHQGVFPALAEPVGATVMAGDCLTQKDYNVAKER